MINAILAAAPLLVLQGQGQSDDPAVVDARLLQSKFVLHLLGQATSDPDPREPVLRALLQQLEGVEQLARPRLDVIDMGDHVALKLIEMAPGDRGRIALARLAVGAPTDPPGHVTARTWDWLHQATQAWVEDHTASAKTWIEAVQRHAGRLPAPVDAAARDAARDTGPEAARARFLAKANDFVALRAERLMGDDDLATATDALRGLGIDMSPCARALTRDMTPEKYDRLMRLDISSSEHRLKNMAHLRLPLGVTLARAIRYSPEMKEIPTQRLCDLGMPLLTGYHLLELGVAGRSATVTAVVRVPSGDDDIVLPSLGALDDDGWLFVLGGNQTMTWSLTAVSGSYLADEIGKRNERFDPPVKALLSRVTVTPGLAHLGSGDAKTLVALCANHKDLCRLPNRDLGNEIEAAKDLLAPLGLRPSSRVLTSGVDVDRALADGRTWLVLHARQLQ